MSQVEARILRKNIHL